MYVVYDRAREKIIFKKLILLYHYFLYVVYDKEREKNNCNWTRNHNHLVRKRSRFALKRVRRFTLKRVRDMTRTYS